MKLRVLFQNLEEIWFHVECCPKFKVSFGNLYFVPQLRFYGKEPPACLFDAVLKRKTDHLKELNLSEDDHTTSILKGLQTAKVFNISACGK